ncbi:hypothetical protein STRTUCAR8_05704 [Streptomyces turgidiscabies Car8]|uniref:Uncharacterized protein n=1 Tax=Streptomyces turgidiscabies (strain Car8) TaxID=698760 RepID=L7EYD3_STRT8|nr:hypothetical protein STRTUCAR8_05704 [Streptomyces turgidiscabies Car8]
MHQLTEAIYRLYTALHGGIRLYSTLWTCRTGAVGPVR